MQTRILLVDDHKVFRMGLSLLLQTDPDLAVIGEAGDGQIALELVRQEVPDVVVIDITMPNMDGIQATQTICTEFPQIKVIALSIHAEKTFVDKMLQAGAVGYILKERASEDLLEGIQTVMGGEIFLTAEIKEAVVSQYVDTLAENHSFSTVERFNEPLVATKLHHPHITQYIIERDRLIELLSAGAQRPLTLVSAPAGYGKSTVLAQWLESCHCPSAWLSLDKEDNHLRIFLRYWVAAVRIQFPDALDDMATLLEAPILPSIPVLARTFVNDLNRLPKRLILVLDDYHTIDSMTIHEFVAEFLRHPSRQLHLVISTRTDPALDLLQMRAYRQMNEVRAQALSFSTEETGAFLAQVVGSAVAEDVAYRFAEETEGWVTGLHLITLSVENTEALSQLSSNLSGQLQTLDFLAAEALSRQPREIQDWLLKTSILDRFCAPLVSAVAKSPDDSSAQIKGGHDFIQWLEEENLFLIQLDQSGHWFRYHHLFQELLQHQLKINFSSAEIATLHIDTAHWLASNSLIDEAIKHALLADNIDYAAQLVEDNRSSILDEDKWFTLEKWLSRLPESIRQERPKLLLSEAWLGFEKLDFVTIMDCVEKAKHLLSDKSSASDLWGEINFFLGYFHYFNGEGELALNHLKQALRGIPSSNKHNWAEAELQYYLAQHMVGQKKLALHELNRSIKSNRTLSPMQKTRHLAGIYFIHMLEGELFSVMNSTRRLREVALQHKFTYAESWASYGLASVSFLQYDQSAAIQEFAWLVENRYAMHIRSAIDALAAFALLLQSQDKQEQVAEILSLMNEYVYETDPSIAIIAESCQARVALMQGDLASAEKWLLASTIQETNEVMLWWIEIPLITACRVEIATGNPEQSAHAAQVLHTHHQRHLALNQPFQAIATLPLLALAYQQLHQREEALATMVEAVTLAQPGRWVWPFLELGQPIVELLKQTRRQLQDQPTIAYVNELLDWLSRGIVQASAEVLPPTPDSLTERELQVLRLLNSTASTDQIAEELVVSIHTLRKHTKNIYSKLDAHSRPEAVGLAKNLNLI